MLYAHSILLQLITKRCAHSRELGEQVAVLGRQRVLLLPGTVEIALQPRKWIQLVVDTVVAIESGWWRRAVAVERKAKGIGV